MTPSLKRRAERLGLPQPEIALTRRPVKDKGALLQTLHLRVRNLRAILLELRPSRWPTPSMPRASTWETASPLPNPLRPTLAVGAHPKTSHQRPDQCPTLGAGLTMASPFREPCVCGAVAPDTRQVCWPQTAENSPHPAAPHEAGQDVDCSLQSRSSEVQWTALNGLSFLLRPRRCQSAPRSSEEKTADLTANDGALAEVSRATHWQRLRLCSVGS